MVNYKNIIISLSLITTSYFFYKIYKIYKNDKDKKEKVIKLLEELKNKDEKSILFPKLNKPKIIPKIIPMNIKKIFSFEKKILDPIILVPDFGESKLYFKWKTDEKYIYKPIEKGWEKIWLNIESLAPNLPGADKWKDMISVDYDTNNDEKFINNKDVEITPWRKTNYDKKNNFICTRDFGNIHCVDKLLSMAGDKKYEAYIFHNLIENLKDKGYKDGQNLFGVSYDFRRITSPIFMDLYYKMFKDLIEHSYDKTKRPVTIVSHGLGCNLTLLFFNMYLERKLGKQTQKWKNKYIKLWIPVNGSFAGNSKSVRVTMMGDNEGLGINCFTHGCDKWYWNIEKLLSGLLWNFPDNNVFQNLKIIKCDDKYYQINQYKKFLELSGNKKAINAYEETILPIKKYGLLSPKVKTNVIISKSKNTEIRYELINKKEGCDFQSIYKPKKIMEQDYYKNLKMNVIQKNILKDVDKKDMIGNGIVPFLSLRTPMLWKKDGLYPNTGKSGEYYKVKLSIIKGKKITHKEILNQKVFLDKINSIMKI